MASVYASMMPAMIENMESLQEAHRLTQHIGKKTMIHLSDSRGHKVCAEVSGSTNAWTAATVS